MNSGCHSRCSLDKTLSCGFTELRIVGWGIEGGLETFWVGGTSWWPSPTSRGFWFGRGLGVWGPRRSWGSGLPEGQG